MPFIRHKQRAITSVSPAKGQGRWINPSKARKGFGPDAQQVITRLNGVGSGLTSAEENAIGTFVDAEVAAGNYDLMDEYFCLALTDTAVALTGFKFDTATAVNAPVHTPGEGYRFAANAGVLMGAAPPAFPQANMQQDNAFGGVYIFSAAFAATDNYLFGVAVTTGTVRFRLRYLEQSTAGVSCTPSVNEISGANSTPSGSSAVIPGMQSIERTAANVTNAWYGANKGADGTSPSNALPTLPVSIGTFNANGTLQNGSVFTGGFFAIGAAVGINIPAMNANMDGFFLTFNNVSADGSSLSANAGQWPGRINTKAAALGIAGIDFNTAVTIFYYTPDGPDVGAGDLVTYPGGTATVNGVGSQGPASGLGGAVPNTAKYMKFTAIPAPVPVDGDAISWPGGTGIIHRAQGIALNIDAHWDSVSGRDSCILQAFTNDISKITAPGEVAPALAAGQSNMGDVLTKSQAAGISLAVQNVAPMMGAGSASVPDWNDDQQALLDQWNAWLNTWGQTNGISILDTYKVLGGHCVRYTGAGGWTVGDTVTNGAGASGRVNDEWTRTGVNFLLFDQAGYVGTFNNGEAMTGGTGSGTAVGDSNALGLLKQYQRLSDSPTDKLHWEPDTGHQVVAELITASLGLN